MRPALDRPITSEEAAVIRSALKRVPTLPEVLRFAASIDHLHAVSRCGCGCDSVDFAEHDPAHPSRIIANGIGTTPAGWQVGVLVWATEDAITGLEVSDLGAGDDDTKLPVPNSILPWPPQKDLSNLSS
jgi:hypothetical protein